MNDLNKVFARRFSSRAALDALITSHLTVDPKYKRSCLCTSLALNLNLTELQITKLLKATKQLESLKDTDHVDTAVLLSTRLDLTPEHIWMILRSKSRILRHSLLNPHGEMWNNKESLNDKMVSYMLSQKWFTNCDPDIRAVSAYMDYFRLTKANSQRIRDVYNAKHPELPLIETGRPASYARALYGWTPTYEKRDDRIREIQRLENWDDYYLNQSPKLYPNQIPEHYLKALDAPIGGLKPVTWATMPMFKYISHIVEKATLGQNEDFYKIFFSLLPEWSGSINELISSASSLSNM